VTCIKPQVADKCTQCCWKIHAGKCAAGKVLLENSCWKIHQGSIAGLIHLSAVSVNSFEHLSFIPSFGTSQLWHFRQSLLGDVGMQINELISQLEANNPTPNPTEVCLRLPLLSGATVKLHQGPSLCGIPASLYALLSF
jgi:hypothetical protein